MVIAAAISPNTRPHPSSPLLAQKPHCEDDDGEDEEESSDGGDAELGGGGGDSDGRL